MGKVLGPLRKWIGLFVFFVSFCRILQGSLAPGRMRRRIPSTSLSSWKLIKRPMGMSSNFHVAEQLGLVDRQDLLDRLEFEQQAAFDQNVKAKRLLEDKILVFDFNNALVDGAHLVEA